MKKKFCGSLLLLMLGVLLFAFCGCAANQNGDNGQSVLGTVKDYFPITENTLYVYEGMGNEYASYTVYNDYTGLDKVQQRLNNGGTETVNVLSITEKELSKVFSQSEVYYRQDFLSAQSGSAEILLQEPLQKGTSWTLADGRVRTITDTEAAVTTPSGEYKTIAVTTEGTNGTTTDYYAKNIGLVKTVFQEGEMEVSSSLKEIQKDVPLTQNMNFFWPNINDEKLYYKSVPVTFYTNDVTAENLTKAYKENSIPDTGAVFTENTQINKLYLGDDGIVHLDLNRAFLEEMNAGAGYEAMILQSVVNTFGGYYGVEQVLLTIEGKPYESGHIALQQGETLQVNLQNSVEAQ